MPARGMIQRRRVRRPNVHGQRPQHRAASACRDRSGDPARLDAAIDEAIINEDGLCYDRAHYETPRRQAV
jgi:hypothetical protein